MTMIPCVPLWRLTTVALFAALVVSMPAAGEDARFSISTDHIYGHKAGMALTLDVVRPTQNANGIGLLYMVSRGWVSDYFDLHAAMKQSQQRGGRFSVLIDRGYTLFMVRHGSSPYFKVPDAVADIRRAARFVRYQADEFSIDPDRIGAFGNSAGGHLALMLGTESDTGDAKSNDPVEQTALSLAAVVAYYPPVDLREPKTAEPSTLTRATGALDFDADQRDAVSPIVQVSEGDAPTLLIHGDKDTTVPLLHSERMHDALQAANVESQLIVMKGAGHAFPGNYGSRAATALADWFDRHLVRPSGR